jgi:UDP-2-acetamido-2,6-beta-L-arabino-hexul-4-ose reductase
MRVLVTGANGFIGKNLQVHLREQGDIAIDTFVNGESVAALEEKVAQADFIFHLAGVNRPQHESEFATGNFELTSALCAAVAKAGRRTPVAYTSSSQAELDNAYGRSKLAAEQALQQLADSTGTPVYLYRLPNVFGKWCRPNYNSAIATFCHNIAHELPIQVNNRDAQLNLLYVDDLVASLIAVMKGGAFVPAGPVYQITLGALADQLYAFRHSRDTLVTEPVGTGLVRALYATYITYFEPEQFAYPLVMHTDPRGSFVEMLKTRDAGQFSFFTAHPGVTRGGHYHHTKTEKFLVVRGEALFKFRHIDTGATHEIATSAAAPMVVETIPGWSHDITNVGSDEMIVMLWANEIFDRQKPDTVTYKV